MLYLQHNNFTTDSISDYLNELARLDNHYFISDGYD